MNETQKMKSCCCGLEGFHIMSFRQMFHFRSSSIFGMNLKETNYI